MPRLNTATANADMLRIAIVDGQVVEDASINVDVVAFTFDPSENLAPPTIDGTQMGTATLTWPGTADSSIDVYRSAVNLSIGSNTIEARSGKITDSMKRAIDETLRRRGLQEAYNKKHNITPETIKKKISDVLHSIYEQDYVNVPGPHDEEYVPKEKIPKLIEKLRRQMVVAAKKLEFEEAARLRDRVSELEKRRVMA